MICCRQLASTHNFSISQLRIIIIEGVITTTILCLHTLHSVIRKKTMVLLRDKGHSRGPGSASNPLSPNTNMHILLRVLLIFLMELVGRTSTNIQTYLYSCDLYVQGYCKEKLSHHHSSHLVDHHSPQTLLRQI